MLQGAAISDDALGSSVELCLASRKNRVVRVSTQVSRATLASVVGSLCIHEGISTVRTNPTNSLAEHARQVLDAESQGVLGRSKRLGKVVVELPTDRKTKTQDVNVLLQKSSEVRWTPARSSDIEALERKVATLLSKKDGKMDAKSQSEFLKSVTAVLEKCKAQDVSLSSDVSARALVALIGT